MGWFSKLLGGAPDDTALLLYTRVIEIARAPHWYESGGVPDTLDGRFDMVAAVMSLVLLRLEDVPEAGPASARLTERFVTDMDGQLRESGIGDIGVGKHIGKMMGMLGGRLGAYRDGLAAGDLNQALARNLYRSGLPDAAAIAHTEAALFALRDALAARPTESVIAGDIA
ncbi:ubiquinol-cytochrome C chaperone family protein [Sphingomonas glacialis]|uniref:Ubiquinol-cytochrome C chaperone n=1 Tax=Sphingomonas glacialis TaxID=658225 RepID=A0A502FTH2_9SPHN|nr:ubiquinol-cytochrome C chaperone family protein [Sphingomonas glacialis]TPG52689.1 ubiquinol-cytochrome C chaperone [Sphingomonas glacialis]